MSAAASERILDASVDGKDHTSFPFTSYFLRRWAKDDGRSYGVGEMDGNDGNGTRLSCLAVLV
jgi:hypothetical protein